MATLCKDCGFDMGMENSCQNCEERNRRAARKKRDEAEEQSREQGGSEKVQFGAGIKPLKPGVSLPSSRTVRLAISALSAVLVVMVLAAMGNTRRIAEQAYEELESRRMTERILERERVLTERAEQTEKDLILRLFPYWKEPSPIDLKDQLTPTDRAH